MKCLDCGNIWKEYTGNGNTSHEKPSRETKVQDLRKYAQEISHSDSDQTPSHISRPARETSGRATKMPITAVIFASAMAFVSAIVGTSWFMLQPPKGGNEQTIELSNVQVRERIGRNGKKIITVKGDVTNQTGQKVQIPPISIILRQTDGGEIIRWRYNSSLAFLMANAKSKFASSIQYDTPAIAYAEAVFE